MNNRNLFYKDISGLRFIGIISIFAYIVSYILLSQESIKIDPQFSSIIGTLKNLSISLFFIISAFLLTAHGLREYKYKNCFNLKRFYMRRLLRLTPTFLIALIFFFIIYPIVLNFLQFEPIAKVSSIKQLLFFPQYHLNVSSDIYINLIFIYGILVILQYYFLWGLILKFLRSHLIYVMIVLLSIGIVFKSLPITASFSTYLYLPYYFVELAIGGLTAIVIRNKSSVLITYIKTISGSKIAFIYFFAVLLSTTIYLSTSYIYIVIISKIILYMTAGFYIIEQTYAKHSLLKVRNSQFIIQFGNLSYGFVIFTPIIAVTVLLGLELIELDLNSRILLVIYPLVCFMLTWFTSFLNLHYIEHFFERKRKTLRST